VQGSKKKAAHLRTFTGQMPRSHVCRSTGVERSGGSGRSECTTSHPTGRKANGRTPPWPGAASQQLTSAAGSCLAGRCVEFGLTSRRCRGARERLAKSLSRERACHSRGPTRMRSLSSLWTLISGSKINQITTKISQILRTKFVTKFPTWKSQIQRNLNTKISQILMTKFVTKFPT